ncbi:MAG: hypothetical protein JWO02_3614 [Solirubrobacterales bacterium]|nr:hypothetical protein [Solirubrobacterales bacterium]
MSYSLAATTSPVRRDNGLDQLGAVAQNPSITGALRAARDLLGMGLAYVTRLSDTEQEFLQVDGDAESFGVAVGKRLPLEETYCHAILAEHLPSLMPDLRAIPAAAAMAVTEAANVGSYVSVAVRNADGEVLGTLCAVDHEPQPALRPRDVQFLHVLARMISEQFERDRLAAERQRMEAEAVGVRALMAAVQARDRYTAEHSRSVVTLAGKVARMLGCDPEEVRRIELVALLHDIGKLSIPDAILNAPRPLSEDESAIMRTHAAAGARLVAEIPELADLAPAIRAEHERWDGSGYPDGLAGRDIPLASRITLVCDAFHAMTSDRPYRAALTQAEAIEELRRHAGTQFSPGATAALLQVLGE